MHGSTGNRSEDARKGRKYVYIEELGKAGQKKAKCLLFFPFFQCQCLVLETMATELQLLVACLYIRAMKELRIEPCLHILGDITLSCVTLYD